MILFDKLILVEENSLSLLFVFRRRTFFRPLGCLVFSGTPHHSDLASWRRISKWNPWTSPWVHVCVIQSRLNCCQFNSVHAILCRWWSDGGGVPDGWQHPDLPLRAWRASAHYRLYITLQSPWKRVEILERSPRGGDDELRSWWRPCWTDHCREFSFTS